MRKEIVKLMGREEVFALADALGIDDKEDYTYDELCALIARKLND